MRYNAAFDFSSVTIIIGSYATQASSNEVCCFCDRIRWKIKYIHLLLHLNHFHLVRVRQYWRLIDTCWYCHWKIVILSCYGYDMIGHTCIFRADSRLAPSQWETSLQSNAVSHWLGADLESALIFHQARFQSFKHICLRIAVAYS